ncbi:MAG: methyltransferase [Kofleriaceae bacterium]
MTSAPRTSDEPIWAAWMAAFHLPTVAVADELRLFDVVRDEPRGASAIADALQVELRATEAIASLMTSLGFLVLSDGRYAITDLARTYLLSDSPYYWGGMLRRVRENPIDCRKLIESLRRGKAASEAALTGMWEAPVPPPAALVAFTHAMHAHSFALAMRVAQLLDINDTSRLLDVAGGSGSYSIAAALNRPNLTCTIFELPPVCEVARSYAEKHGVADRIATATGNMFSDGWPTGHDRLLMADIFHDWGDARCALLAKKAFDALVPGGKVLLHEMLLSDAKDGPLGATSYSMIMVYVTEGRQRSAIELRELLVTAGFVDVRVTPTANGFALIEGTKPQ